MHAVDLLAAGGSATTDWLTHLTTHIGVLTQVAVDQQQLIEYLVDGMEGYGDHEYEGRISEFLVSQNDGFREATMKQAINEFSKAKTEALFKSWKACDERKSLPHAPAEMVNETLNFKKSNHVQDYAAKHLSHIEDPSGIGNGGGSRTFSSRNGGSKSDQLRSQLNALNNAVAHQDRLAEEHNNFLAGNVVSEGSRGVPVEPSKAGGSGVGGNAMNLFYPDSEGLSNSRVSSVIQPEGLLKHKLKEFRKMQKVEANTEEEGWIEPSTVDEVPVESEPVSLPNKEEEEVEAARRQLKNAIDKVNLLAMKARDTMGVQSMPVAVTEDCSNKPLRLADLKNLLASAKGSGGRVRPGSRNLA